MLPRRMESAGNSNAVKVIISIVQSWQASKLPVFAKQLGRKPCMPSRANICCTHPDCDPGWMKSVYDKNGGDISEWATDRARALNLYDGRSE